MLNLGAVILAAGMSRRMGQPKLLLSLSGKPLFRYTVEKAIRAGLEPIVLISGEHTSSFQQSIHDLKNVEIYSNELYSQGMSTSLRMGIKVVSDRTQASMIFLADQPLVPDIVVKELLETYKRHRSEGVRIVRPQYKGIDGHPIVFDAELYPQFQHLQGDEGGRSIIKSHSKSLKTVHFEQSVWGFDIDTQEDLNQIYSMNPDLT